MQGWTMQFQYCGTIEYRDTGYLNRFLGIALHDTTLYYFSIPLPLSSTCLHGYSVATVNRQ